MKRNYFLRPDQCHTDVGGEELTPLFRINLALLLVQYSPSVKRARLKTKIQRSCIGKAGFSWGCVSAVDSEGRTIWIVDAHSYGKRFVVHADELLTAFRNWNRLFAGSLTDSSRKRFFRRITKRPEVANPSSVNVFPVSGTRPFSKNAENRNSIGPVMSWGKFEMS